MKESVQVLVVILVGLLGGVAVGLQGPISGVLSQRLGPVSSSLILHAGGAVVSAAVLLLIGGERFGAWRSVNPPLLFGGALGLVLFLTLSVTLPRIGASSATTLLIAAQLVVALVIDQMGWFGVAQRPIDLTRLAGVGLMIVAAVLITKT